jgi:molybdopterin converting factor small subunit
MATVNFTYALKRFFPGLSPQQVEGVSVKEIIAVLEQRFPGMRGYILDDQGRVREHVNIFINGELIRDRTHQAEHIESDDEVFIMQALSGGI